MKKAEGGSQNQPERLHQKTISVEERAHIRKRGKAGER